MWQNDSSSVTVLFRFLDVEYIETFCQQKSLDVLCQSYDTNYWIKSYWTGNSLSCGRISFILEGMVCVFRCTWWFEMWNASLVSYRSTTGSLPASRSSHSILLLLQLPLLSCKVHRPYVWLQLPAQTLNLTLDASRIHIQALAHMHVAHRSPEYISRWCEEHTHEPDQHVWLPCFLSISKLFHRSRSKPVRSGEAPFYYFFFYCSNLLEVFSGKERKRRETLTLKNTWREREVWMKIECIKPV